MKLWCNNVSVVLDGSTIVRGVDLVANHGQLVGIVGPNGSGKTTLLRAIYRALEVESGAVRIDDQDIRDLHARQLARMVGVVAQGDIGEFNLTGWDLAEAGRTPHVRQRLSDRDREVVARSLERCGVANLANRPLSAMSGGEKQRVLVARALAQEPGLLVLDEPTNHLDIRYQLEILSLLRDLDMSCVIALHDLNLAADWCDTVYVMKGGCVVGSGRPDEALRPQLLGEVFEVEVGEIENPLTGTMQLSFRPLSSPSHR